MIQGGSIGDDGVADPAIIGIALDGSSTDAITDTDGGELDGDAEWDRAIGPMQFIPETWQALALDGNGDGVLDPQQIDDAALTAAAALCGPRRRPHRSGGLDRCRCRLQLGHLLQQPGRRGGKRVRSVIAIARKTSESGGSRG